ncbi:MAG: Sua5 family C-terminal domain-containing protein, partial [Rickettsiaceae bacterium]|nr:Sua5 family C-terminal domain-containing protein [Rickettsiaceae bacterium]
KLSPTNAEHADYSFNGLVPVLDGGDSIYGLESTILDCTAKVRILRHGFITEDLLSDILGYKLEYNTESSKAPGGSVKHYSPTTLLRINAEFATDCDFAINFGSSNLQSRYSLNLSPRGNLLEAASNLFNMLNQADIIAQREKLESIAVAKIPNVKVGIAINDKLKRGSSNSNRSI